MTNITFDNQVLKIYDSEKTPETLTLKFLASMYPMSLITSTFHSNNIKEKINHIVKTTETGDYVCSFNNYTSVTSISSVMTEIVTADTKEVQSLDENNKPIIVVVPDSTTEMVELIVVTLKYEDPVALLVEKLNKQINPKIDVETCTLEELKAYTQEKNKKAFADFLYQNPLLGDDLKYYGITKEDQEEMQTDLTTYNLKQSMGYTDWKLKWHDQKKACREFTLEEFTTLYNAIVDFVSPYRELQEKYKQAIYDAKDKSEILNLKIEYKIS